MTRKQRIETEIEAALKSIDNLVPASPSPFFYTRVTARLNNEEKNVWGRLSRIITRPVFATLSVVAIVAVNIFAVVHHAANQPGTISSDQTEIAVADEYNRTSLYNIDNIQP